MTEFYNLRSVNNASKSELTAAFNRVLESGWYVLGKEVNRFESEFANYCEVGNCIGVGNCLDALQFILQGFGIGSGDEVIVPSNTYIATWLAASNIGAITRSCRARRLKHIISIHPRFKIQLHQGPRLS